MKAIYGWKIDKNYNFYRISIQIKNPDIEKKIIRFCLYDTGFSGYLGLDKDSLDILQLKPVSHGRGMTVKGLIDFDNYEVTADIIDKDSKLIRSIENIDEESSKDHIIPVQEFDFPILGLKAIRQFSWLINSDSEIIFLLK